MVGPLPDLYVDGGHALRTRQGSLDIEGRTLVLFIRRCEVTCCRADRSQSCTDRDDEMVERLNRIRRDRDSADEWAG